MRLQKPTKREILTQGFLIFLTILDLVLMAGMVLQQSIIHYYQEQKPEVLVVEKYLPFPEEQERPETQEVLEPNIIAQQHQEELEVLAKVVYQEAGSVESKAEQAAVIWCILNWVDKQDYLGDNIISVATYPGAFAWEPDTPIVPELLDLALDVWIRWNQEKGGKEDVGRTLPSDYYYFIGDGSHNYFTKEWKGTNYWDWRLEDPYKE